MAFNKAEARAKALERIATNIRERGSHVYTVLAGTSPRYAYTIGLRESLGYELVLAGGIYYMLDEARRIVDELTRRLREGADVSSVHDVEGLGTFTLREADASWTRALMLGAYDYYGQGDIVVRQIVPDEAHWTIDVPDLSRVRSVEAEPVWRWMDEAWAYPVRETSTVMADLDALRGKRIIKAARWEDDYWEMFAVEGEVPLEAARVVSLAILVAWDPSLVRVMKLEIGKGVWRHAEDGDWHRAGEGSSD